MASSASSLTLPVSPLSPTDSDALSPTSGTPPREVELSSGYTTRTPKDTKPRASRQELRATARMPRADCLARRALHLISAYRDHRAEWSADARLARDPVFWRATITGFARPTEYMTIHALASPMDACFCRGQSAAGGSLGLSAAGHPQPSPLRRSWSARVGGMSVRSRALCCPLAGAVSTAG
jgi:hypothetical protein